MHNMHTLERERVKSPEAPPVEIPRREGGDLAERNDKERHDDGHNEAAQPIKNRPPAEENLPRAKKGRRLWVWAIVGIVTAIVVTGGVLYYLHARNYVSTDDSFITGHVVQVSPRVSGHVAAVDVTDNQWVNKGDLLVALDPRDFENNLHAAEAALESAKADHLGRAQGYDAAQITYPAAVQAATAEVARAQANVQTAIAAVATAKSSMAQTVAQAAAAEALLKQAQADLVASEARRERAETYLRRVEPLVPEGAVSKDTLDKATAAEKVAAADVQAARQKIDAQAAVVKQADAAVVAAESSVKQAEAGVAAYHAALEGVQAQLTSAKAAPHQIAQSGSQSQAAVAGIQRAQAQVDQAKLSLSYTKIHASTSGHVTRKSVEAGDYVQTGQPLLDLVEPNLWVVANYKETELDRMRPGQPVTVTVDAYPGVAFAAHVDSIQRGSGAAFSLLPPENATGNYVKVVQRVPVKIVFNDLKRVEDYALGPGMSVVPTVDVQSSGTTNMTAAQ